LLVERQRQAALDIHLEVVDQALLEQVVLLQRLMLVVQGHPHLSLVLL
jgi:hypothetical protein